MVRYQALQAAKAAKSENSVRYISQMLYAEQETSNIIAAAQALGEIGSVQGVAPLLYQLRLAKTQGIVYEVAVALGKIGDQAALSDLIDLAQNEQYYMAVRQAAIDAVRKLGQDVGIPATVDAIREEDLEFLAQSAAADACAPGNPKEASIEDFKAMFRKIMKH